MQFNSIPFLFCFFPLFFAVYYIIPVRFRSALLVLGSLVFYGFAGSDPAMTLGLLVGLTLFSYFGALLLARYRKSWLLGFVLAVMAGILVLFKCYDGGKLLPAGMSFYLFQLAAYVMDVYNQRMEPERSLSNMGVQTFMFPKVMMGPLADPRELQEQVRSPGYSLERFHRGLQEVILGLGLKVLLADRVGGLWAQASTLGYENISPAFAWLSLLSYAMRLYFDFWGYSVMAVGLGHMLGFCLPENFLDPYASRSVSEFWRRWHATLGAWFRNYLYIPLGGSRRGTWRTALNLLVVWLFTGLWHGVGGNYLLWAMFLFAFILMERLFLRNFLDKTRVLCHVYTVAVILISWVPFAIGDWSSMVLFAGKMFGVMGPGLNPQDFLVWGAEYFWLMAAGVFCMTPLPRKLWDKCRARPLTDAVLFLLFWVVVFFIATSAQDPFMYFQY